MSKHLRSRNRKNPTDLSHLDGGANWEPVLSEKKLEAVLAEKRLLEDFKTELEKKLRALNLRKNERSTTGN